MISPTSPNMVTDKNPNRGGKLKEQTREERPSKTLFNSRFISQSYPSLENQAHKILVLSLARQPRTRSVGPGRESSRKSFDPGETLLKRYTKRSSQSNRARCLPTRFPVNLPSSEALLLRRYPGEFALARARHDDL